MIYNTIKHILIGFAIYIGVLALLLFEPFQSGIVYMHWLNYPRQSLLKDPSQFTISKDLDVFNFYIESDGNKLGVYHFLSLGIKQTILEQFGQKESELNKENYFKQALLNPNLKVILFFHGNAGNRASPIRYPFYKDLCQGLNSNLLVLDYRGFGDSEGTPSEEGLFNDALSLWKYLIKLGIPQNNISIVGHSLGTGVATSLVHHLNLNQVKPKTLLLSAPYTSIYEAMYDYKIFRIFPLLYPIKAFPSLQSKVNSFVKHKFDTKLKIHQIATPTIVIHGHKDGLIPIQHSKQLTEIKLSKDITQEIAISWEFSDIAKGSFYYSKDDKSRVFGFVEVFNATHDTIPVFGMYSKALNKFWDELEKLE